MGVQGGVLKELLNPLVEEILSQDSGRSSWRLVIGIYISGGREIGGESERREIEEGNKRKMHRRRERIKISR